MFYVDRFISYFGVHIILFNLFRFTKRIFSNFELQLGIDTIIYLQYNMITFNVGIYIQKFHTFYQEVNQIPITH